MRVFVCLSFILLCLSHCTQLNSQQTCKDDCSVQYLTQPVQDLNCNPYNELYKQLRLGCSASGPIGAQIQFLWYRVLNASTDVTPELLSNDTEGVVIYPQILRGRSRSTDSLLILEYVRAVDAGRYWCQVSVNGSTFQLLPSQETMLAPPEVYVSYPLCPRHLFTPTASCADNTTPIIFDSDSHDLNTPLASDIYTCNLLFLNQPPSHLPCNPYEDDYDHLRLECSVLGPSDAMYRIEWYRQLVLAAPQVLTDDLPGIQVYTTSFETGVLRSRFTLFHVDEEDIGTYWCQVSARNGSHVFENQMRSHHIFLDRRETYNSCAVCPDVYFFSPKFQCADTLSPTPSLTPQPTPSLTHTTSGTVFTPVNESHGLPFWVWVSISIVAVTITVAGLLLTIVGVYKIGKHCADNRTKNDVTNNGRRTSLVSNPLYSYPFNIPAAPSGHEMANPDSYQGLSSHTKDYTTIYAAPSRNPMTNIELDGHLYSMLDATTREPKNTYMTFQQGMP